MKALYSRDHTCFAGAHQLDGSRAYGVRSARDGYCACAVMENKRRSCLEILEHTALTGFYVNLADLQRVTVCDYGDLREHISILERPRCGGSDRSYRQSAYSVNFSRSTLTMCPPLRSIAPPLSSSASARLTTSLTVPAATASST